MKRRDLTSHQYISQRLKLHYIDWGNTDAPPLILLHGGRDHCRSWDWVADRLSEDFHVIAPDLRGHGDSEWSPDGNYSVQSMIYDLAQLVHHRQLERVNIVAHSLGGHIALRYAAIFPEQVARLVAIEGLGLAPDVIAQRDELSPEKRIREWIEQKRALVVRRPRRFPSMNEALARMQSENTHLSADQVQHLTVHGISQNEDGTFSWKFDNQIRLRAPVDLTQDEWHKLWSLIECPVLLFHGNESWASDPSRDGRLKHFQNARFVAFDGAGHWVHHDKLDQFLAETRDFLLS